MIALTYHSITKDYVPDKLNAGGKHVPAQKFEEQMRYLSQKDTINADGIIKKNNNSIIVTIDDGFKNNYEVAFPILKKYNIPFIIFLCTGFMNENLIWTDKLLKLSIDVKDFKKKSIMWLKKHQFSFKKDEVTYDFLRLLFKKIDTPLINEFISSFKDSNQVNSNLYSEIFKPLSWDEVRSMVKTDLCFIGSHTVNHPILSKCDYLRQYEEIENSKLIIEDQLNEKVSLFAYPNGSKNDYNVETLKILKKLDFKYAFTTRFGYNRSFNPFEIERIGITSDLPMWKFKLLINRLWRPFA